MTTESEPGVDLYWLPLGAGGHSVRLNELVVARRKETLPDSVGREPSDPCLV